MNKTTVLCCRKLRRYVETALTVLLACTTLIPSTIKAQQSPAQEVSTRDVEPTFKLQSERNLVLVRVVVRNGKGETVDNLHQEDFQLFDHGKKQTILQFSVEKSALTAAEKSGPKATEPPAQKSAGKSSPTETRASEVPPPSSLSTPRRFVALYFDDVNTGFQGLARTREALDHFLQTPLHPGDRMGVFTASGQKSLDFTDDLAKVRQALADLRPSPLISVDETCGQVTPYMAYRIVIMQDQGVIEAILSEKNLHCSNLPAGATADDVRNEAVRVLSASENRAQITLRGIESLVRFMSTLPGQRSIVLVSNGFLTATEAAALSQISDHALRANVVINGLGARGLNIPSLITADASVAGRDVPTDPNIRAFIDSMRRAEAVQDGYGMATLAQDTGGIFLENNNDLEGGFRRAAAIPDTSYTLAFSPENLKHDGAFHPLKVTLVSAKGLSVQARKGYYAPQKAEDLAVQEKEDLQDAVFSQNEMQSLPIQVNAQFFMLDKTDAEIFVVTHINLQQVHFRKEGDRNLDNLTLVTAVFDRDGHYVVGQQKVLELRLRDQSLEKVLRAGVKIEAELKVKAGTYLVRTVVLDSESGQISAVNRTVEIPY
jgi:VWFA-related protein